MADILLVEPNPILARQYCAFLGRAGHRIAWCRNAQSAINQADTHRPDIVLTELLLPAHSGIEFLYEFRSYGDWQTIPAVLLTRIPRDHAVVSDEMMRGLGLAAYLYKPKTTLKKLAQRIDSLVPARVQ